jgi:hypothetical protein
MATAPHHRMSRTQYHEYLQYLRAHHFSKHERRLYRERERILKARKERERLREARHHGKRGAAAAALPGAWITGGNDVLPTCGAAATANSLLAATGHRASDADIMVLHQMVASGGGVVLGDLMEALMDCGLGGAWPVSVLRQEILPDLPLTCHVLPGTAVVEGGGDHAWLRLTRGVATWGDVAACPPAAPDERWLIRWR